MSRLFDALLEFVRANGIEHEVDDDPPSIVVDLPGPPGTTHVLVPFDDGEQVVYWAVLAPPVPEARRPAMAELLCRINYGLLVGNLEMDWEDGELRCKTSIDFEGSEVEGPLVTGMIRANIGILDRYTDAILAVASGSASPADAIAAVDG